MGDPQTITTVLKVLQVLVVSGDMIGEALVPYYRQLLPVLNMFKGNNNNLGDQFDYGQRKRLCMGDLIEETLQALEINGGGRGDVYQYQIHRPDVRELHRHLAPRERR